MYLIEIVCHSQPLVRQSILLFAANDVCVCVRVCIYIYKYIYIYPYTHICIIVIASIYRITLSQPTIRSIQVRL